MRLKKTKKKTGYLGNKKIRDSTFKTYRTIINFIEYIKHHQLSFGLSFVFIDVGHHFLDSF
jgi:hypothetical protein